jgi:hypothetical protein
MTDEDVQSLLRKRHCAAAFELLLDRYPQKVFRLVYSILKEAARAEEVTQDVFLRLWQVLPDYDGRASLSTWLYTITRNTGSFGASGELLAENPAHRGPRAARPPIGKPARSRSKSTSFSSGCLRWNDR